MFDVPDKPSREQRHHERATEVITHLAAQYIARNSNGTSLITALRTELGTQGDRAIVYVSIFPESSMVPALEFLKRQAEDFRQYVRENSRMRDLPRVTFAYDPGEHERRLLDELGKSS